MLAYKPHSSIHTDYFSAISISFVAIPIGTGVESYCDRSSLIDNYSLLYISTSHCTHETT